jgi:photosystem II stability/assembly factor-like uncharacterized protein
MNFFRIRCAAGALLALAVAPALASAGWVWQNPQPTSYDIWGIDFADADSGVLVGEGGLLMTTADGGATWTPHDSGVTIDGTLYRVHHVGADTIVAAGAYVSLTGDSSAVVARSTDGGATWVASPPLQSIVFADAYFTDADHGVAVGGDFSQFLPTVSRTSDGGASWDTQDLSGLGYLLAVSFPDPDTGFAVGYDFGASQALAFATTDGGATWQPQSIASDQVLNDVRFADATHGVAVGNAGALFVTSDGGATWDARDAGIGFDLHSVTYNGDTIVVSGGDYVSAGAVAFSTDGGTTWTPVSVDRSPMFAVFSDASNGTAAGSGGALLHTSDGGASWSSLQTSVSEQGLFGVAFSDVATGTAVGGAGLIVATKDGGQSWHVQTSNTAQWLYGIAAPSADNLIAVGGDITNYDHVIVGTDDGGTTWTDRTPSDLLVPLLSIACTSVGHCTAVGMCGTIVHTDDAGATWTTQRATDCTAQVSLESVAFRDADNGIAVGVQTILQTTDGGATWNYQQPPTGQDLRAVFIVDADHAYIVGGTDHGVVLNTSDGGASWTLQRDDIATPVQGLAFANANEGIAVMLDGSIMRTHDGATWADELRTISNLYGVAYPDDATAITVGFSNYNAAILGWSDRLFGDGFD